MKRRSKLNSLGQKQLAFTYTVVIIQSNDNTIRGSDKSIPIGRRIKSWNCGLQTGSTRKFWKWAPSDDTLQHGRLLQKRYPQAIRK